MDDNDVGKLMDVVIDGEKSTRYVDYYDPVSHTYYPVLMEDEIVQFCISGEVHIIKVK